MKARPKTKNTNRDAKNIIMTHRVRQHSRNAARLLRSNSGAKTEKHQANPNFYRTNNNMYSTQGDYQPRCETPMTGWVLSKC